jgi:hypothetical protein
MYMAKWCAYFRTGRISTDDVREVADPQREAHKTRRHVCKTPFWTTEEIRLEELELQSAAWNGYHDHSGVRSSQSVCTMDGARTVVRPQGSCEILCSLVPATVCSWLRVSRAHSWVETRHRLSEYAGDETCKHGVETTWVPATEEVQGCQVCVQQGATVSAGAYCMNCNSEEQPLNENA